jgi:BASS family bile acid:Na+ symporter
MLLGLLEAGVPLVAFLLMVAVGLDVTRADLSRVVDRRLVVVVATLAQAVALPATASALVTLSPSPAIEEYVLLVAACPGGGMSNVYVYLARANTALSVTLTAVSSMAAVVTMPIVFAAYSAVAGQAHRFALPLPTLIAQLLVMTVIPVALGAWIRDRHPAVERRHGGTLRAAAAAGVAMIVVIGLVQSSGMFTAELLGGGAIAAVLAAAGMALGYVLGIAVRAPEPDRFTLLVEFAVRNLAIAMVIEVTLLGRPDFIPFGALALLAQAVLLGIAVRWRLLSDRRLQ